MYLLREAAASKEINLQRLLLFIPLYPIVPTFLVSKADDSVRDPSRIQRKKS